MSNLNKKLYDYYTKPENISSVISIYRDFPKVQEQLIDEFWDEVNIEVVRKINTKVKEWHHEYSLGKDQEEFEIALTPKSMLYEKSKSACWLSYWNYGNVKREYALRLWVYEDLKLDYPKIIKEAKKYELQGWKAFNVSKDEDDILIQWIKQDFADPALLETLIPANRNHIVKEYAERIVDAAKELKPLMLFVHKSKK